MLTPLKQTKNILATWWKNWEPSGEAAWCLVGLPHISTLLDGEDGGLAVCQPQVSQLEARLELWGGGTQKCSTNTNKNQSHWNCYQTVQGLSPILVFLPCHLNIFSTKMFLVHTFWKTLVPNFVNMDSLPSSKSTDVNTSGHFQSKLCEARK